MIEDLKSVLPAAQLCIGAEQGDIGHDVGLQACRVHVVKHQLHLQDTRHTLCHSVQLNTPMPFRLEP